MIVSVLAYAGLRPGELRALRWADVRERAYAEEAKAPHLRGFEVGDTGHSANRPDVGEFTAWALDLSA